MVCSAKGCIGKCGIRMISKRKYDKLIGKTFTCKADGKWWKIVRRSRTWRNPVRPIVYEMNYQPNNTGPWEEIQPATPGGRVMVTGVIDMGMGIRWTSYYKLKKYYEEK